MGIDKGNGGKMKVDDITVKFKDFDPSEVVQHSVEKLMRRLHEESPYGSSLKVSFVQTNNVIKGVIQITSAAASFVATSTGDGLKRVSMELAQQIHNQLSKWKITRFK
jgi:hypothetical protein